MKLEESELNSSISKVRRNPEIVNIINKKHDDSNNKASLKEQKRQKIDDNPCYNSQDNCLYNLRVQFGSVGH